MNRTMGVTVVMLLASLAAAVATSAEPMGQPRAAGQQVAAATSAPAVAVTAGGQATARSPAQADGPRCEPDAAARYREWHHGGLKLAPGCAASSRG